METHAILIIEDDLDIGKAMERTLVAHGFVTARVQSTQQAIELWQTDKDRFCLVLVDVNLNLKEGSGFELATLMKAQSSKAFFVFMSGFPAGSYAKKNLVPGINFLEKPFQRAQLLEIVRLHCKT